MALQGKLILNGADYSPLTFDGIGIFMAFSGNGAYRNKGACGMISDNGPLPSGKYYIVDRPTGSKANSLRAWAIDTYKSTFYYHVDHTEWFALYRADGSINDSTFFQKVARGGFRLHPGTVSDGCITLANQSDYNRLRAVILGTKKEKIPGSSLEAYGTIEVINNGYPKTCP
ncbi:DUF2778 domain-containing protein [Scandinavium manionii]|uniref:DUF2778 domain-containing protein n=1 Tax=Scandinavium manionii TaxID=2926520 RepID=UPI002164FBCD|nr:DUF2778 domain-containing protein [Scandinavium manionii]MCS2164612.1 DUF2778 domain-containing protein [Scandinavium manionii]